MTTSAWDNLEKYRDALKVPGRPYEFLCELPTPPGYDLEKMLHWVGQHSRNGGWESHNAGVLAWAAVLFCGEHEGGGGFRGPFMEKLGYSSDKAAAHWDNGVGQLIREAILKWCGHDYEVGVWKNVGPVRLHAGIPKPLEACFAELLFHLAQHGGLSQVSDVSPKEMRSLIDQRFAGAKFAKEFLHLDSGRAMIDSCASHLDRAGWPGDTDLNLLDDEPGYRPGFLRNLYEYLERIRSAEPTARIPAGVGRLLIPRLYLDIDTGRLGIRFPGLDQRPAVRYELGLDLRRVDSHVLFLGPDLKPLNGVFEGTAKKREKREDWSITAWPRRRSTWALFTLEGELVGSHGDQFLLDPGVYVLATAVSKESPIPQSAELGALGWLQVDEDDYGIFQLLEVNLTSELIQRVEGVQPGGGRETPALSADETHSSLSALSRFAHRGLVFLGESLQVRVEPWAAGDERFYRLVHERDGQESVVTTNMVLQDGFATLHIDGPAHHGRLRIEKRGRNVNCHSARSTMSYTLWSDPSRINLDQKLYGCNESASISIEAAPEIEVVPSRTICNDVTSLSESVQLHHRNDEGTVDPLTLDLHVTVPRARLDDRRGSHAIDRLQSPLVIDFRVWQGGSRSIGSQDDLLNHLFLSVRPGEPWKLVVESLCGKTSVLAEEVSFERHEHRMSYLSLRYSSIEDALKKVQSPVGSYRLSQVNREVGLGALHIDSKFLCEGGWVLPPVLADWVPENLEADLRELAALQENGDVDHIRSESGIGDLQPILAGWRALARVFAGQLLEGDGPAARLSRIIAQVRDTPPSPAGAKVLLDELRLIDTGSDLMCDVTLTNVSTPSFVLSKIAKLIQRLSTRADARKCVVEAMEGIRTRTKSGEGASDDFNNIVCHYEGAYRYGRINSDCFNLVKDLLPRHLSNGEQPWVSVGKTLGAMNLLRMGEVNGFLQYSTEEAAPLIGWLKCHLRSLAVTPHMSETPWDLAEASILEDDKALQALCSDQPHEPPAEPSWLYRYIQWRLLTLKGDSSATDLGMTLLKIPSGENCFPTAYPDSSDLREEIQTSQVKAWK